ncbi:MAG TPA: amidohydrolase [Acidobacteriota bacterium]
MALKHVRIVLFEVIFALLAVSPAYPQSTGSVALVNGTIYTVDDKNTIVQALLIRDGRIAGLGTSAQIKAAAGAIPVVDLKGRAAFPGFIDSHGHMLGLGQSLQDVDLVGAASYLEVIARVRDRARKLSSGQWILGRGWDQNRWQDKSFPSHQKLSAAVPDNPVYLTRIDGHAGLANAMAMKIANLDKNTPDPDGGRILRDGSGNPTGVLIDNAQGLVRRAIPRLNANQLEHSLIAAVRECNRYGLTEVHDAGIDGFTLAAYKHLLTENKLNLRVYSMLAPGDTLDKYFSQGPETALGNGFLTIRSIKLVADGALGSRGAALLQPYSDDPSNSGLILRKPEEMQAIINKALQKGFQVCTHAIGDRTNRLVLDLYETGLKFHPKTDHRFRIEHAQVIAPSDFARFKKLGVIPSMQQVHCTSDMYWAEKRLGPERAKGAYAWRTLLDDGNIIAGGSDFPVESVNPLLGFYAAITRRDAKGWPKDGWHPEQRMTRDEALRSFTRWAAYAAFEEKNKGSLETGKWGDITVFSRDIMKIDSAQVLDTQAVMTVVAGRIVYQKPD